jgi:PBSX family phage terminase large subunit
MAIAKSNAKINIWSGAVRSGKSFSATLRFLIEVAEAPDGDMAIITRDANAFRRNVLPILRDLVGPDVTYKAGVSLIELWGRKIHLVGCHDQRAEGKLRGSTLQAALVDEASIIPESSWIVLIQRTAMNGGRVFATTNPDSSQHWLKKNYIDDNQDVTTFNFGLLDNPKLKDEEREFLKRQHHGVFYRRFIEGEWCLSEGAIFDFFDTQIHTINRVPGVAKFYICGVDVGFSNATGFVLIGFNDDLAPALWVEDEYYYDPKKSAGKTDSDYANDLYKFVNTRHNVRCIYVDPAAAGFRQELKRSSIGVPVKEADNSVLDGIRLMSTLIANGDLKVMSHCKKPIKRADHLLDATRYAIYSHFGKKIQLKEPDQQSIDGRTLTPGGLLRQKMGDQYPGPMMVNGNDYNYKDAFHGHNPLQSGNFGRRF